MEITLNVRVVPDEGQGLDEAKEEIFESLAQFIITGDDSFFSLYNEEDAKANEIEGPYVSVIEMSRRVKPTPETVTVGDLLDRDGEAITLIGDWGGTASVSGEIYESLVMPGLVAIETEHGTVYLEPELEVQVLFH